MAITLHLGKKNGLGDAATPNNKAMDRKLQILYFFLLKKKSTAGEITSVLTDIIVMMLVSLLVLLGITFIFAIK